MGVSNDPALADNGLLSRRRLGTAAGGLISLGALFGALVDCSPSSPSSESAPSPRAMASASAEASLTMLRATFPGAIEGGAATASRTAEIAFPSTADGTTRIADPSSGVSLGFRLVGATSAVGQTSGDVVTYPDGGPEGSDVVHRIDSAGLEDFVAFWQAPQNASLRYELDLDDAAGLRLVARSLEVLDEHGAPRLRVAPPYVVDRSGERHAATLDVEGCAVDDSPVAPWGRAITEPGARTCTVVVRWPGHLSYPLLVDPQWQLTSNLLGQGRRRATATVLQPGNPASLVLIAGGFSTSGGALTSSELYHPLSRSFASTGSLNAARGDHAAASLRNTSLTSAGSPVVVTGGRQSLGGSLVSANVLEVFDPATGQWTVDAVAALPRAGHTATLLQDETVLVVGGIGTNGFPRNSGAIYTYDDVSKTGTLSPVGNTLADERAFHSATLLPDATVLLVGGHDASNVAVGTAQLYDPTIPGFAPLSPAGSGQASMTVGRMRHTATLVIDDANAFVVLLAGGTTGVSENGYIDIPDVYRGGATGPVGFDLQGSPDTMVAERSDHTATLLPTGEVLLVGGRGASGVEATAELASYNPTTQAFSFSTQGLDNTPSAREEHVAALVNAGDDVEAGRAVLIAGGANGAGGVLTTAELLLQIDGEACQLDAECASGHCIEGVCCDTECAGDCYTCVLAGNVGTCTPVPAGTNLPPSCVTDVTVTNQCDGNGNTIPITAQDCKPGVCNATGDACVRRCDVNAECYVDAYCCFEAECRAACGISGGGGGGGASGGSGGAEGGGGGDMGSGCCADKKGKGAPCADAAECLAPAFCVDGVCCENECDGDCESCEATSGACLTLGTADGPVPPNKADVCPGDGACTGVCNGSSADMCFFPNASQLAEPATCVCDEGFTDCHLQRRECDGNGAANEAPLDCEGFRCEDDSACKTSCVSDDDCILDFICEEGTCTELTGPSCDGNFTVRVPDADDIDCRPFACRDTACLVACESVDDCVPVCANPDDPTDCQEYVCNAAGECVQPIVGPEVADCSCRVVGGSGKEGRSPWWLGLAVLALGWRRDRRRS